MRPAEDVSVRNPKSRIPSPKEEAESKVYRDKDGFIVFPSYWFRASILNSSKGAKLGKMAARNVLGSSIFVTTQNFYPLRHGKKLKEYTINTQRAVIGNAGILRSRPLIETPWELEGVLEYDAEMIAGKHLTEFLTLAGRIAGIGDQRPGAPKKPGWFGLFVLTDGQ